MINGKTYYQIIGLLPDAEDIVIRAAYRTLSQKYHPDKWTGDPKIANERMAEINISYEILSDANKRSQYDNEFIAKQFEEHSESMNGYWYNKLHIRIHSVNLKVLIISILLGAVIFYKSDLIEEWQRFNSTYISKNQIAGIYLGSRLKDVLITHPEIYEQVNETLYLEHVIDSRSYDIYSTFQRLPTLFVHDDRVVYLRYSCLQDMGVKNISMNGIACFSTAKKIRDSHKNVNVLCSTITENRVYEVPDEGIYYVVRSNKVETLAMSEPSHIHSFLSTKIFKKCSDSD
jgi:hypothetical protein